MLLLNLIPNKSFPNSLTIKLIGVRKIKKTKAIIIGAIIDPNISPNLIQILFKGDKSFEFKRPRNKKMTEKGNGASPPLSRRERFKKYRENRVKKAVRPLSHIRPQRCCLR